MPGNVNLSVVHTFVDELWNLGVRHICISPGSRSTPVTMSVASHGHFEVHTLLDERSGGYFALGLAKRLQQPVLLVCTSGTAAANYHPAVMEAKEGRVPLLVLTADRPAELHQIGANQTVSQTNLFGSHVKWAVDMPIPEDVDTLHRHAAATAVRAFGIAMASPPGPVHINWPFREPLVPMSRHEAAIQMDSRIPTSSHINHLGVGHLSPSQETLDNLCTLLAASRRPLIVVGPQEDAELAPLVFDLARRMGAPVLADPLSQLRTGVASADEEWVIDTYDWFIRPEFRALDVPDLILRIGRTPTSKGLSQYFTRHQEVRQVVCSETPVWLDASLSATYVVVSSPTQLLKQLLRSEWKTAVDYNSWTSRWVHFNQRVRELVSEGALTQPHHAFESDEPHSNRTTFDAIAGQNRQETEGGLLPFEGRLWGELSSVLHDGTNLFVGNSMPIRDMDRFFFASGDTVRVFANRGVSGIDGVVSSAAGVAGAFHERTILVIGDVSFYHDLNGLLAVMRENLPLCVILVHNDGGGIFTGLPQASVPELLHYFQTPHGLDFRKAVEMYGGVFTSVCDWAGFRRALSAAVLEDRLTVVELRTSALQSTNGRQSIQRRVQALDQEDGWE